MLQRVSIGYAILLSVWFVAWLTLGDSLWWLSLINRISYTFFLPIPVLLAIAALYRKRVTICACLVAILVVAMVYLPTPTMPMATNPSNTLRVMSFNVLFSNTDVHAIAAVISAVQPDVVGLQEVQPAFWDALTQELAAQYPYSYRASDHPYGTTALLSRFALHNPQIIDLGADRQAVLAQIEHDSRILTVASAHLLAYGLEWVAWQDIPQTVDLRVTEQNQQARLLLAAMQQSSSSTMLLMCDCNSPETAMTTRILHRELRSVGRSVNWWLPTYSRPQFELQIFPNQIDYIFFHGDLIPTARYTWSTTGGSDHQPLIAEFCLIPPAAP